jgi:plasmid maintenance system antidote protein VapI
MTPPQKKRSRGRARTTTSPLAAAMAASGTDGPRAVTYLIHALGVSRAQAYNLLRGGRSISEENARALSSLLGQRAVERLRMESQRQAIEAACAVLVELRKPALVVKMRRVLSALERALKKSASEAG